MRRNLSLIDTFKQDRDTSTGQHRDASSEQSVDHWTVMVLALGGTLTLVWIGFLLWAAFQLLDWASGG